MTVSLINEIVSRCLRNGIFDAGMHQDHSILTSARIQTQYFDAVKRREVILVKKEYLLVSVDKIKGIAYENNDSACRNEKNACRNDTMELNQNKTKINITENARETGPARRFEDFLSAYPKGCNRYLAEREYASLLSTGRITEDELVSCALNYAEDCKARKTRERYMKNAENFLKDMVFEGYLPGKYKRPATRNPNNSFSNFPQREYDFEELEKKLLGN